MRISLQAYHSMVSRIVEGMLPTPKVYLLFASSTVLYLNLFCTRG